MEKKARLSLKSCNLKSYIASGGELEDRLSQLPDEILLLILSSPSFTMKDVAGTSVLSRGWKNLWEGFPFLNFEDSSAMKKLAGKCNDELLGRERSRFINWVNGVVKEYLGLVIDEFSVTSDLDKSSQSHIDKWLTFALTKQVKSFELNLKPACVFRALNPGCTLYYFVT